MEQRLLIGGALYLIDEPSPDRYTWQTRVNDFSLDGGGEFLFVGRIDRGHRIVLSTSM